MEVWKKINCYDYEISNYGRVRTIERTVSFGSQKRKIEVKVLKPHYNKKNPYKKVALCLNGKHKTFRIHRLVALYFIGNTFNKKEVNHIDGNKLNNIHTNLEWCTRRENSEHALINNLYNPKKGINHAKSKLKEKDINKIRKLILDNNINLRQISESFNVSRSTIQNIKDKKTWKHIT